MRRLVPITAACLLAAGLLLQSLPSKAQAPGAWPNGTTVVETLPNLSYSASSNR